MRIGIDARCLAQKRSGINTYVSNLLRCLHSLDHQNEYFLYSNRDFNLPFESPRWKKRIGRGLAARSGTIWLMWGAGRSMMRADRLDVFWGTQQVIPAGIPGFKAVTVHDLVWHFYPETMSAYNRFVHRILGGPSMRRSNVIFTVSEAVRDEIRSFLRTDSKKIFVAYNAAGPDFSPGEKAAASATISSLYGVSQRYILSVGTIEPRKNLVTLLRAYALLLKEFGVREQLLIVGAQGWKVSPIQQTCRDLGLTEQNVRFLGHVPDAHMPLLYRGAAVFVFPTRYEGFGLPLIEAMACGCPCVGSDISVLREISAGACLHAPPSDPRAFAVEIRRILSDGELAQKLIKFGQIRSADFSWMRSAELVLKTLTDQQKN